MNLEQCTWADAWRVARDSIKINGKPRVMIGYRSTGICALQRPTLTISTLACHDFCARRFRITHHRKGYLDYTSVRRYAYISFGNVPIVLISAPKDKLKVLSLRVPFPKEGWG